MRYTVLNVLPDGTEVVLALCPTEREAFREAEWHGKRLGINPVIRSAY